MWRLPRDLRSAEPPTFDSANGLTPAGDPHRLHQRSPVWHAYPVVQAWAVSRPVRLSVPGAGSPL